MPTIEVLFSDLQQLVGRKLPTKSEELSDLLAFVKSEVESFEGEKLSIEVKDGNRPDLWSVEGISRALRGVLGIDEGLAQYVVKGSIEVNIRVDKKLEKIRPYIASTVVKNINLSSDVIQGFMYLQDKLDQTYGRKRTRASIGLYDFDLVKPPLHYTVAKPTEISFTPLGKERKMSLKEIVEVHPKGLEYGKLVKAFNVWPILVDAKGDVLSFPPIINSATLGKVTENTRNILIEVTGLDHSTVINTLNLVTLSVADRGGEIFPVQIQYPYAKSADEVTPNFATSEINLDFNLVNEILGLDLSKEEVIKLLKKARYEVYGVEERSLQIRIPCYRVDIMHPVDLIEDIAIMYGYNNIQPSWPGLITFGEISNQVIICDAVREIMTGLGFQEILSFSLTAPQNLFEKMNLVAEPIVEIVNPINERFTCLRSWLMPNLMDFLSNNTHISYPQMIFEVGECAILEQTSITGIVGVEKLACLSTSSTANFSQIQAILEAFLRNLDLKCEINETTHGSFIDGRVGAIFIDHRAVGFIGEINPRVLEAWKLENPVIGFEVDLGKMFDFKKD
ncbi:MAG: phenylalanine--tRNA ligase subunit beta [Candidatus Bathyarchaeota archaeon]